MRRCIVVQGIRGVPHALYEGDATTEEEVIMWIRRIVLAIAIVFGVGFGFVLSSCMPPVDGQASDFPPLTVGQTYQFYGAIGINGEIVDIGPYPWIEILSGGQVAQVNVEQVVYIREQ